MVHISEPHDMSENTAGNTLSFPGAVRIRGLTAKIWNERQHDLAGYRF